MASFYILYILFPFRSSHVVMVPTTFPYLPLSFLLLVMQQHRNGTIHWNKKYHEYQNMEIFITEHKHWMVTSTPCYSAVVIANKMLDRHNFTSSPSKLYYCDLCSFLNCLYSTEPMLSLKRFLRNNTILLYLYNIIINIPCPLFHSFPQPKATPSGWRDLSLTR